MSEARPRDDIPEVFQASAAVAGRLTHLIPDELALAVPDHPLFAYAKTNKPADGFVDVTARQFARGVNRASWYLKDLLGEPTNFETIGYMGPSDLRYFFLMFGAIKVGYKMLFTSPRNNLDGHLHVLAGADCHVFLSANGTNVDSILEARRMRTAIVPELADMLEGTEPVAVYPYTKTFEEACMDPCLVLHTTGSTGLPKPIVWKNANLASYEAWRTVPAVDGYVPTTAVYQQARRAYTSMPLFHTSGLNAGITWSLLCGVTLVYGAPKVVPNAGYADEMHLHAGSRRRLDKMQYVVASGAPLSQTAGRIISKHSRVISNLGSTETSCLQRLSPSVADWDFFYWHPSHSGIEMREYTPGLFELFLVRKPGLERYQGIFATFPSISEWSMSDLYERHPDPAKPFLYRYKGRKDDVIVLSNGEKVSPALMEATLNSSPLVKGAMVVGRGRFQPAVLLDLTAEPPRTAKGRHELIDQLLPFIAEANAHAPAHGQLDRYHVLFADPQRPVQYLGQGKMQRLRTYALYEADIDKLYRSVEEPEELAELNKDMAPLDLSSKYGASEWLRALIAEVAGISISNGDGDIFEAGVDSLQVIKMAREIRMTAKRGQAPASLAEFSPRFIYANPTVNQLGALMFDAASRREVAAPLLKQDPDGKPSATVLVEVEEVTGSETPPWSSSSDSEEDDADADLARSLLEEYTRLLPPLRSGRPATTERSGEMTVILTGSTGSLGPYILEALNRNPKVARVICLNRSAKAAERHALLCSARGFAALPPSRVQFLKADLSLPQLGLGRASYGMLVSSVTHIIHNQWPVNFNWPLQSFRPHIHGVINLAHLAHASRHNALVLFVSSVSTVASLPSGTAPEAPIHDVGAAAPMGYGRSKLVAEILLDRASQRSGVRSAVCRVGIVAGPVESTAGMWNKHEYIPSIMVSSAHLGVFPATFPSRDRIDWLPVDRLAIVLLEILHTVSSARPTATQDGTHVFHVVNPRAASWHADLSPVIAGALGVREVDFSEWVSALRASADEAIASGHIDLDRNPAIRLLEFYEGAAAADSPRMLTSERAEDASLALAKVGPVGQKWLRVWLEQWGLTRGRPDSPELRVLKLL
ncbi:putative NRPS-like enzyme [Chaetomium fimeti]|uniref:NRPS-like enzyme n=1 Tax=Chaetomium fimeti TaxID=1854472 RepID=A0AAE0HPI2_9PEZI|nr:putative NRPS-like enzyme [Chaetomium fimeti]